MKKYTNLELLKDIYFTGYKILVNYQGLLWRFIEHDNNTKRLCFYNSMQGMMWVDNDNCMGGIEIVSIEKEVPHFKNGDRVRGRGVKGGIVYHVTETSCTVKDCDGRIVNSDIEHLEHDNAYYLGIRDFMDEPKQIEKIDTDYFEGGETLEGAIKQLNNKLSEVIDKLNEYERGNNRDK